MFFITVTRFFHDIEHDQCYEEEFKLPKIENLKIGFIKGAKTGKDLLAGFPKLSTIPFTSELALNEVKILISLQDQNQ